MDGLFKKIYYDIKSPAGFSSVKKLFDEARLHNSKIKIDQVREWLSGQKSYSLHRPKRKSFIRNHVVVTSVDELWQADLVDMQSFKKINSGYGYILTIIDVMSKYAFAVPIKTKHGKTVADAFEDVFKKRIPVFIQTDQGKEFLNPNVRKVFGVYNVHHYTTLDEDIKCSVVERFNRTLRTRMFRYFTHKGGYRFTDILRNLVKSYNDSVHRSTGMKPSQVTMEDESYLFKKLYGYESKRDMMLAAREDIRDKVTVGSAVRIKFKEKLMDKGYYPSWSDEVFTVTKIINAGRRKMYVLSDWEGEIIKGRFYPEEIQVIKDDTYRIQILRSRVRAGIKESLVHWIGFPASTDSWIRESDIVENG